MSGNSFSKFVKVIFLGHALPFFIGILLIHNSAWAQWHQVLSSDYPVSVAYFVPQQRCHLAFACSQDLRLDPGGNDTVRVWRSTDDGKSWEPTIPAYMIATYPAGIVFEDSLKGWLSLGGHQAGETVLQKTIDGGKTWFSQSFPNSANTGTGWGIYYINALHRLIFASNGLGLLISDDEGLSWTIEPSLHGPTGYYFLDSLHGAGGYGVFSVTTDGGLTWKEFGGPLTLGNTPTGYFSNGKPYYVIANDYNNVLLTTDEGETWDSISHIPGPLASNTVTGNISTDCGFIYLQTTGKGIYRSADSGKNWISMGGPPGWAGGEAAHPSAKNGSILAGDARGGLWLYTPPSPIATYFADSTKLKTVKAGDTVSIFYRSQMDALVGVDSAHFAIHYDPIPFNLLNYKIPSGWSIINSNLQAGLLDLWLVRTGAEPPSDALLQVTFSTFLSTTSTIVYLDSAHLYGHRLNCDCSALSVAAPDSVEIDFTGCEDSVLLGFMHSGSVPFTIQSIHPNPARDVLQISIARNETTEPVTYELLDALGIERQRGSIATNTTALDVSPLSGVYYLRILKDGFVQTRRVVIER